jgi:hypothetical protein
MSQKPNTKTKTPPATLPLSFDIPLTLRGKLAALHGTGGATSISGLVRKAVANFDYEAIGDASAERGQISIRIPAEERAELLKVSRKKGRSVGSLLRLAIESFVAEAAKPAKAIAPKPALKAAPKPTPKPAPKAVAKKRRR